VAHAHAGRYGTSREQLTAVPVKNRRQGATNPLAMFREPVTAEQVAQSRLIADPLRLYDCSPIADGAAAAIVTSGAAATAAAGRPVRVLACEQASGPTQIAQIDDLTSFPATRAAADRAYRAAGVAPGDIDVVELHDCFSIAEIVDAEDLGLLPRGEAAEAIAAGTTSLEGAGPTVNPSGGLLARGHPVGATGLAQIHELVEQLRASARLALAHNLGGCGATATVTILAA
jgi:acetyl-CoA C-acetyltransferase